MALILITRNRLMTLYLVLGEQVEKALTVGDALKGHTTSHDLVE